MQINLTRPLIFFDLETTGTNVLKDRIVEISAVKLFPDGNREEWTYRVNPGMHIPEEATAVHHITDDMVADKPLFSAIAQRLHKYFEGCDIAGFNSNRFDVPLLIEEFGRAGLAFDLTGRHFVDVQNIFHKKEKRTLEAAYRFYCNKDLKNAHSASADTLATVEVLEAQLEMYPDLKNDITELSKYSAGDSFVDLMGNFKRNAKGETVFNFGKHKGKKVADVFRVEPSYYNWIINGEFSRNTKNIATAIFYEARKSSGESDSKQYRS